MSGDRSQAFTLEAFFAATIILSAIVFALQASAVTPLTSSTSSQQLRTQQATLAEGFLSSTQENGQLKDAILHWDASEDNWRETSQTNDSGYYNAKREAPKPFADSQIEAFSAQTAASIEIVSYQRNNDGELRPVRPTLFQDEGRPTENTVVVEKQIVLYDDDRLTRVDGGEFTETGTTVSDADDDPNSRADFYASDISSGTDLHNVVTVRVTVWRI